MSDGETRDLKGEENSVQQREGGAKRVSDGGYGLSSVGVDPTANSSEDSVGGPFLCVSIVYPHYSEE